MTPDDDRAHVIELWDLIKDPEAKRYLLVIMRGLASENPASVEQAKQMAAEIVAPMTRRT